MVCPTLRSALSPTLRFALSPTLRSALCRPFLSALRPATTAAPLVAAALVSLAAASPSHGQPLAGALSTIDPDSVLAVALRDLPGEPLTLQAALDRALASAPQVAEAEASLRAAQAVARRERGAFDPELFANVDVEDRETPSSSAFEAAPVIEERTVASSFGARTTLPFGTSLEAAVDAEKSESNSAFRSLPTEYRAFGRLEVRQPLLRGFGPGTGGSLGAAEERADAEQRLLEQAQRDVRAETESRYWQLYAAERDFVVQELIVDQANALLEQARVRAQAGLIGPDQVANARVFVAQQRLRLLDQEEQLAAASDLLAEQIGGPGGDERRFHTIDAPDFADDDTLLLDAVLDADALAERARGENLEIRAARLELAALAKTARAGKWNALPQLDLFAALGGNGLSGRGELPGETGPRRIDGGAGSAIEEALGRDYPTWSVGVEMTLPILLRSGRGERDRAEAEAMRQRARIAELERQLASDLRDAVRRYENGAARLALAREGVEAAREQVRVGLIEFDNGRSTAFELVRLAADLATAQQELSRALVRTATARADLQRLVGPLDGASNGAVPEGR